MGMRIRTRIQVTKLIRIHNTGKKYEKIKYPKGLKRNM
jgi:hypothetical protein